MFLLIGNTQNMTKEARDVQLQVILADLVVLDDIDATTAQVRGGHDIHCEYISGDIR